jgi:hypothetical protein
MGLDLLPEETGPLLSAGLYILSTKAKINNMEDHIYFDTIQRGTKPQLSLMQRYRIIIVVFFYYETMQLA